MSTDVPVHHYACSFYFFFFDISCTMTFQRHLLGYIPTDPSKKQTVYLHASLLSNHKDLPVTTATSIPLSSTRQRFYCSLCPQMYLFITKPLLFRHTLHNDLSTDLLGCLPTDPPEYKFTCLPSCFSFV